MDECPTCGRKIRGEFCPYCDEERDGEEAGEAAPASGEGLVETFSCEHQWQADFIVSLLESEGIPAYRRPASSAGSLESSSAASKSISIQVEEEDTDRAREIIESAKHDLDAQEH
jgi:hypothetical protein